MLFKAFNGIIVVDADICGIKQNEREGRDSAFCKDFMTVFDKIREKNRIIALIVKLQNTTLFPAVVALICVFSATSGAHIYIPCIYFITALSVFAGLFSDDLKVFCVPALLAYYAIGMDVPDNFFSLYGVAPTFNASSIPHFAVCIILLVATLLYRLIERGYLREMLEKRGIFFWGLVMFGVSLPLGGIFSSSFSIRSFVWGGMIALSLLGGYVFFTSVLSHSNDGIAYICKTLVSLGYAITGQIIIIAIRLHLCDNLIVNPHEIYGGTYGVNRSMLVTSWGRATIIGGALVLPIVACMYLLRDRRFSLFTLFSAFVFFGAILFNDTRSAIICGAAAMIVGVIICCIKGKNRVKNRITVAALSGAVLILAIIFLIVCPDKCKTVIDKAMVFLRFDMDMGFGNLNLEIFASSRFALWKKGIEDFLSAPLFGVGFTYGTCTPETATANLFECMYHNIGIQLLASLGVVGLLMFLVHIKFVVEVLIRNFSGEKLILLIGPALIIVMSLLDNFFFYPNFILIYTAFLACAEVLLEQKRKEKLSNFKKLPADRKPRVVFTYVEAGKGHIVPTHNVCESFKKKYGDEVEVIESKFFTETNSPEMEKTEVLFRKAVQNQNRSPVLSFLCKLGNLLAGDTFALYVLLKMTFSGRKTNPRAVEHVRELDADIIYTAHWSIPFYVNQLKGNRPYVICFCPDVYSNGAFNVDCNKFLISSDVGYNQVAHRMRMYAGGNIEQIPFPMRPEVERFKGEDKKRECRQKLGIPDDEFVVVLCDGGYGMAKLEKTARLLMRGEQKMTVIALCGTNEELYKKLSALQKNTPEHIRLIAVDFTDRVLEYITCADVFAGKSGANSIAEPASLGIPIIVTKCITYIERGIKNYYVHRIKGAVYIPSAHRAAKRIQKLAQEPARLERYRTNLLTSNRQRYDAEASADVIYNAIKEIREEK